MKCLNDKSFLRSEEVFKLNSKINPTEYYLSSEYCLFFLKNSYQRLFGEEYFGFSKA